MKNISNKDLELYAIDKAEDGHARKVEISLRMLPMRDGVALRTQIALPSEEGVFPAVFIRSPYTPPGEIAVDSEWLEKGVAVVKQDCRGTGGSEGILDPNGDTEAHDAFDTIEWLKTCPWFNGRAIMKGGSYCGRTQWFAALGGQDELKGLAPDMSPSDIWAGNYIGGALFLQLKAHWNMSMAQKRKAPSAKVPDYDDSGLLWHLPLKDIDLAANLGEVPCWRELLEHPSYGDFWRGGDFERQASKIKTPAYIRGGWFDICCKSSIRSFQTLRANGGSEKARYFTRLVMGPWTHLGLSNPELFGGIGEGRDLIDVFLLNLLKSSDADPLPQEPPVRYFMMGANEWRSAEEWPPAGTKCESFFLHSISPSNSSKGGGKLSSLPPGEEVPERFIYDPGNPVPTRGGFFIGPKENGMGSVLQNDVEGRDDVLVFTGDPLTSPLEIAGGVMVRLFASSSARDTDFTAKLVDLHPDGSAYNVCGGILRARYRDSFEEWHLMEPDVIYEFQIDCWHTAHRFKAGHSVRLEISSSNFPHFDRNPNTGHKFAEDEEMEVAEQRVYHDSKHPSCLILPVLRRC